MTYGSLFSGIGGIDLALDRSGMTGLWQAERDATCLSVLARHWPGVQRFDDVRKVRAYCEPKNDRRPIPWVVRPDLLCGGFPCQDLSVAGRRAGLAGSRSGLWFTFRRIVSLLRPKWVLVENVPGLLSSNRGRDLGAILWSLGKLGYGWAYRVLDAQHFGVPQRRERVFIVGCLGDVRRAAAVLFESDSGEWNPAARGETGARVAACLRSRSAKSRGTSQPGRGGEDDRNLVYSATGKGCWRENLPSSSSSDDNGSNHVVLAIQEDKQNGIKIGNQAGSLRADAPGHQPCGTLLASAAHAPAIAFTIHGSDDCRRAGSEADVAQSLRCRAPGQVENCSTTVALAWTQRTREGTANVECQSDLAYSLDAPKDGGRKKGGVVQGMAVRRLTPLECERLQGLPDGWTATGADGKPISDSARYRMIGNSVAVPCLEWIGRRIMAAEDGQ